jgi:hypothetical protein
MGVPSLGINVVTFSFVAEVSYPVADFQVVSLIGISSRIFTLVFAKFTLSLTAAAPSTIGYANGFILWIALASAALIPAFAVEEDLRRLNLQEVTASSYVEEETLKNKTDDQRAEFTRTHVLIADPILLEELFFVKLEPKHRSEATSYSRHELIDSQVDDERFRRGRNSDDLVSRSSTFHSKKRPLLLDQ